MDRNGTKPLRPEQRADIVTARETIKRAVAEQTDADLRAAAAMPDRVLERLCPHGPQRGHRPHDAAGRAVITSSEVGGSWHSAAPWRSAARKTRLVCGTPV